MDRLRDRVCVVAGVRGTLGEAVARRFADEEQVRAAYERVWRELGRVDVIYNNAGLIEREDHSALDLTAEVSVPRCINDINFYATIIDGSIF